MNIESYMNELGKRAREASRLMSAANTAKKNNALIFIAKKIKESKVSLLKANKRDLQKAKKNNLEPALLDRLELTDSRINAMVEGLEQVISLSDPVGALSEISERPSGIKVGKMRVPLGVIGIIYESRPNVTIEAASLCLKSGNAVILRGGSEALESNQAIAECIYEGLEEANLPVSAVQVLNTPDRAAVGKLITMKDCIDVIIPRGGKSLIERISSEAKVPVIKHLDGNCHVFIDDSANVDMAIDVTVNSKTQRYGTCNTAESVLVSSSIASQILPPLVSELTKYNVELRVCHESRIIINNFNKSIILVDACEQDWYEEYLAPIISIKVVKDIEHAISHINKYSSGHSESIITTDYKNSMIFIREVDSSSVMINASTRFADGFEYGLGAEIGISTDKFHARGPVGLEGLTSQKFVVFGNGETRK